MYFVVFWGKLNPLSCVRRDSPAVKANMQPLCWCVWGGGGRRGGGRRGGREGYRKVKKNIEIQSGFEPGSSEL